MRSPWALVLWLKSQLARAGTAESLAQRTIPARRARSSGKGCFPVPGGGCSVPGPGASRVSQPLSRCHPRETRASPAPLPGRGSLGTCRALPRPPTRNFAERLPPPSVPPSLPALPSSKVRQPQVGRGTPSPGPFPRSLPQHPYPAPARRCWGRGRWRPRGRACRGWRRAGGPSSPGPAPPRRWKGPCRPGRAPRPPRSRLWATAPWPCPGGTAAPTAERAPAAGRGPACAPSARALPALRPPLDGLDPARIPASIPAPRWAGSRPHPGSFPAALPEPRAPLRAHPDAGQGAVPLHVRERRSGGRSCPARP